MIEHDCDKQLAATDDMIDIMQAHMGDARYNPGADLNPWPPETVAGQQLCMQLYGFAPS